ncbi:hypothetical protein VO54_03309 [Elizabethkingia miricola]|nr:hypothetical protein VO54_03309 [Elizabethkingia miricola]
MIEKLKVLIWTLINMPKFRYRYYKTKDIRKDLQILNSAETIQYIITTGCSVSRFGDGELQIMSHYLQNGTPEEFDVDTFQNYDAELGRRLIEVFKATDNNVLVCLPYQFKDAAISKLKARVFWEREYLGRLNDLQVLGISKQFGDTNFTRFYLDRKDIPDYPQYINQLQKIWKDRDVVMVEGEFSRVGVGNGFLDNAMSVERIICPPTNAFSKYNEILDLIKKIHKSKLIMIALGHTATVLAYDLSKLGYQAIDIGHIDVEYEWFIMKAKSKVAIPDKYVNEVNEGRINTLLDNDNYKNQIIGKINF